MQTINRKYFVMKAATLESKTGKCKGAFTLKVCAVLDHTNLSTGSLAYAMTCVISSERSGMSNIRHSILSKSNVHWQCQRCHVRPQITSKPIPVFANHYRMKWDRKPIINDAMSDKSKKAERLPVTISSLIDSRKLLWYWPIISIWFMLRFLNSWKYGCVNRL